jgi:hypothetical protein
MMGLQNVNLYNIQSAKYLPTAPSGNTVQVMNGIASSNNASAQYAGLSDVIGQAMTADMNSKLADVSKQSKGLKININDIKSDARIFSKMTPAMLVSAGLELTDAYGNTIIGAPPPQQQFGMQQSFAPQQANQQRSFAPQQPNPQQSFAPQQSNQQQFAMAMMQQLEQMQAQIDKASMAPAPSKTSVNSSDDSAVDFWGNPTGSTSSKTPSVNPFFDAGKVSTPSQNTNASESSVAIKQMMQMMQMMFAQSAAPAQNTMQMPQQGFAPQQQFAPQQAPPQMTILDIKAAMTPVVFAAPQTAPKPSAVTQRVMQQAQESNTGSRSGGDFSF